MTGIRKFLWPLWFICLAFGLYWNCIDGPFYVDDYSSILNNPAIRDLGSLFLKFQQRYLVYLTFGFNYALGGLDPSGYRLLNIVIHGLNGFLVFLVLKRILEEGPHGTLAGLIAGTFFVVHPVQTQAVSYIVQRFASMATFFYLLTIFLYLRFRTEEGSRRWWFYGCALLSSSMAMLSKETAFTLPVALVLFEFLFISDKRPFRWWMVLGFFVTALLVPLQHLSGPGTDIVRATRVHAQGFTWPRDVYFYTEMSVVLKYWALVFWPAGLRFYYGWPEESSVLSLNVIGPGLIHIVLILSSVLAVFIIKRKDIPQRWLVVPFGILWFYLTLSVESTFIPIPDFIFEHRLYLPLSGVSMALAFIVTEMLSIKNLKYPAGCVVIVVLVVLAWQTFQRNNLWSNDIAFWKDNINKEFAHVGPYFQLGIAYQQRGMHREAVETFNIAAKLRPDYYAIYELMGRSYESMNFLYDAVKAYQKALSLEQEDAFLWAEYARALLKTGQQRKAREACQRALRLAPQDPRVLMQCKGHPG